MNSPDKRYAIIVAGGSGSRMQSSIPKQFIEIAGLPILMHTINRFREYDESIQIVVVLPKDQHQFWKELCHQYRFSTDNFIIAEAGQTRFQSVKNGLTAITINTGTVAIHDGVRPLVSKKTIHNCYILAEQHGNAIAAVPLKESIRQVEGKTNKALDRSRYISIQTPQCFNIALIKKAFESEEKAEFTDDASVLEAYGENIILAEGEYCNIKITTPEDLLLADALLRKDKN
ncbi:MAG: 2-C-methyl-D-erythritol 4-phosphate cytidylyltransferase [Cytophagaceae bacterium]